MDKNNKELKLLKLQNEMLRKELEMSKNKKSNNDVFNFTIIILFIIIFIGVIFLLSGSGSSDNDGANNSQEKSCVRWENVYNNSLCEYNFGYDDSCRVTGQKCVEWE